MAERKPRRRKSGGRNPTAAEAVARAQKVVALRLRPMTWAQVAKEVGISDRRCRAIWAEWRDKEKPALEGLDPIDWVVETYHFYEHQIEKLADLATLPTISEEEEPDPNRRAQRERSLALGALSPIVGALNSQRQARESQKALLQETGYLPHNLGRIQVEIEMKQFVGIILRVLDDHEVTSPEVERDLLNELDRAMGHRRVAIPEVVDAAPAQENGSSGNGADGNGTP